MAPLGRRFTISGGVGGAVALLALVLLVSCGLLPAVGDATRTVTFHNAVGAPITLFTYGHDSKYRVELVADGTYSQGWMFPISSDDTRVRRVQAEDRSGNLVFCADLTYSELVTRKWRIEIGRTNTCAP